MQEIGFHIKQIYNQMERWQNQQLKVYGITSPQLDILLFLHQQPEQTAVMDIAAYFHVKHTSVLHVIKSLEEKELIYRAPSERKGDKRPISLTPKALSIIEETSRRIPTLDETAFHGFSEEDKYALLHYLERLNQNIQFLD